MSPITSIIFEFIALTTLVSSQIDIGTDCDCTVSVVSTSGTYAVGEASHGAGACSLESADPMDVWQGTGVVFKGTSVSGGTPETFDYRIDCAHSCSISQVNMGGAAFCGDRTTLQLWNGDRTVMFSEKSFGGGNSYYD